MNMVIGFKKSTKQIIADKHSIIDIVDGQQRITTLALIYKAISKELDGSTDEERMLKANIDKMLVKPTKDQLLLLQTNHDTSSYFTEYMRSGVIPNNGVKTIADTNLRNAMLECEGFVRRWKKSVQNLVHLAAHLNDDFTFIYDEIHKEEMAYSVFEVLNSRGMLVSPLDLLKTLLMGKVFKQECGEHTLSEIRTHWSETYRSLNSANSRANIDSEILRFAGTLYRHNNGKLLNNKRSVEVLMKMADKCNDMVAVASMIRRITQILNSLSEDARRVAVTKPIQARLVNTAIRLREDIPKDAEVSLLKRLDGLTLRIHCLHGKDAKTETGSYVRLAHDIHKNKISAVAILDELESIEKKYPLDDSMINELISANWYPKYKEEVLYILFKYEERVAADKGLKISDDTWNRIWGAPFSRTIEHVSPQKENKPYSNWLGNLLTLPPTTNSRLRASSPANKVEAYNRSGLFIAQDVASRLDNWDEDAVREQGRAILTWLQSEICPTAE